VRWLVGSAAAVVAYIVLKPKANATGRHDLLDPMEGPDDQEAPPLLDPYYDQEAPPLLDPYYDQEAPPLLDPYEE
jgi:hypothetical protein